MPRTRGGGGRNNEKQKEKQNKKSPSKRSGAEIIKQMVRDMTASNVGIETKKFIVYTMERMEEPDISEEYITFCTSSYFILGEKLYEEISLKYNFTPIGIIREQAYTDYKKLINAGISNKIMQMIKLKTENLAPEKKTVILEMDENVFKPEVKYSEDLNCLVGYEDDGVTRTTERAEFATIIWVHSIVGTWKMPVCFMLSKASSSPEKVKSLLFRCIPKLEEIGLDVVALVTKMRTNFYDLMPLLQVTPDNPTFRVGEKEIVFLFEAAQLMNITRNSLMTKKIRFNSYETSWKHVKFIEESNREKDNARTKLKKHHIKPNKQERVVPRYAIEVLSNAVAAEMKSHVSAGTLPAEAAGTAEFINLFATLYELFNSSASMRKMDQGFRGTEDQCEFLTRVLAFLGDLQVVDKEGNDKTDQVKFINGWHITINGLLKLWRIIEAKGHPFLLTSNLRCYVIDKFTECAYVSYYSGQVEINTSQFLHLYTEFFVSCYFTNEEELDESETFDLCNYVKKIYNRIPPVKCDVGGDRDPNIPNNRQVDKEINKWFENFIKEQRTKRQR